jgi:ribose transport system ATP-binding protein
VENLSTATGIRQVSFAVQRGEIFGLAGLMGSGRTELLRAIFGADRKTSGAVYRGSSRTPVNIECPRDAVRAGIAFVTEDRKGQGLFLPWSVQENISMTSMRKVQTRGFIQRARERAVSEEFSKRLRIRCASVEQPVAQLSGGNQQKVVLAKWLFAEADILLFDEPTRGIDVGAKYEIYELLINLAGSGKSVLVVSSELPELLMLCHRIGVLCRGRLAATFNRAEFDPARIMAAAFGGV